jgi:hypothetical protein
MSRRTFARPRADGEIFLLTSPFIEPRYVINPRTSRESDVTFNKQRVVRGVVGCFRVPRHSGTIAKVTRRIISPASVSA